MKGRALVRLRQLPEMVYAKVGQLLTTKAIQMLCLNPKPACLIMMLSVLVQAAAVNTSLAAAPEPEQVCNWLTTDGPKTDIPGGYQIDDQKNETQIRLSFRPQQQNWSVATIDIRDRQDKPLFMIRLRAPCQILQARRAHYNADGELISLHSLASDLKTITSEEPVNPPATLPLKPAQTHSPILALSDTGVNYLLPELQPHIARTEDGGILGYDFWDKDNRPFDIDPRRSPYYPLRHGTTVFSVLAAEAPDEPIVIYRFPALEMCRYQELVEQAAQAGIRIMSLSMGSRSYEDWTCFEQAARSNSALIFIISAGNDGQDIDKEPIYPAALDLENLFVVSSSDAFGRPGPGANLGRRHVDILVPAEQVEVIDHRGVRTQTGGTSYAAPRVAALAARYLRANPDADTQQIISFLQGRAIATSAPVTAYGWIPDPTDDFGF